MENKQKIVKYIIVICCIVFVAVIGSIFVNIVMDWFSGLDKPIQFVPNFIIPIVWTVIYVLFAITLCLWVAKDSIPKKIIVLLITNGILNILWCLVFFTLNQTFLGLISIILLLIMAYYLVLNIAAYKPLYFYLTTLYPIWASIATCLNLAVWILN